MSSALPPPVGGMLRAARELAGLTVDDVAGRTRIDRSVLARIEDDDFSHCGGDYFARGHLRSIATALGIDPRPVVERFDQLYVEPEPIPAWAQGQLPARPAHPGEQAPLRQPQSTPAAPAEPLQRAGMPDLAERLPSGGAHLLDDFLSGEAQPTPAPLTPHPATARPAAALASAPSMPTPVGQRSGPNWRIPLVVALLVMLGGALVFLIASIVAAR